MTRAWVVSLLDAFVPPTSLGTLFNCKFPHTAAGVSVSMSPANGPRPGSSLLLYVQKLAEICKTLRGLAIPNPFKGLFLGLQRVYNALEALVICLSNVQKLAEIWTNLRGLAIPNPFKGLSLGLRSLKRH